MPTVTLDGKNWHIFSKEPTFIKAKKLAAELRGEGSTSKKAKDGYFEVLVMNSEYMGNKYKTQDNPVFYVLYRRK